jgi:multiple sugar transport system permease protein
MKEETLKKIFVAPLIIFLVILVIYPLVYSIYMSLHINALTHPELGQPFVGLGNYVDLFLSATFRDSALRTIEFVLATVSISFFLGLGSALIFSRLTRGKTVIRTAFIIPTIVSPIVVALIWRFMLHPQLGVINYLLGVMRLPSNTAWLGNTSTALLSLVLIDVWEWTPLMTLIILAGLISAPKAPFEAAKVDGLSKWTVFRKITFPMIKPMMMIAILIRTMDAWKTFDIVFTCTKGGPGITTKIWPFFAYRLGWEHFRMGLTSAFSVIMLFSITLICMLMLHAVTRGGKVE